MSDEITKIRFDYAWKWFDFHAKQRTTMFNFFLLIIGIVGNGIFTLMRDGKNGLAGLTSLIGAFVTVGFIFLEFRNKALVDYGEEVLAEIEKADLTWKVDGKSLLLRESEHREPCWIKQHKFWIPCIEFVVGASFFVLGIYNLCCAPR